MEHPIQKPVWFSALLAGVGAMTLMLGLLADTFGVFRSTAGLGRIQFRVIALGASLLITGIAIYLIASTDSTAADKSPRRLPRAFWLLVGIVGIGAMLRFYRIGYHSLWVDELASWHRTSHATLADALWYGHIDSMWPGYHIPLYFTTVLFGDSELGLRFPSMIFGILQIPLIYQIGRRLYSHREGVAAALLVAVLLTPIAYSQEARTYSMLMFFTLLAAHLWLSLIAAMKARRQPSGAVWLKYAAVSAMVIYLHIFGVLLISLQAAGALIVSLRQRQGLRSLAVVYGGIGFSVLPLALTIPGTLEINNAWIKPPGSPLQALLTYLEFAFNDSLVLAIGVMALWGTATLLNLRRVRTLRNAQNFYSTLLLIFWFGIPAAALYLFSVLVKPAFVGRYLVICLPAVYLLLARSLLSIPVHWRIQISIVTGAAAIFLTYMLAVNLYYSWPQKEQFREAVYHVAEQEAKYPEALIVGYAGYYPTAYLDYYFAKSGSERRVDLPGGRQRMIGSVRDKVNHEQIQYIWFVMAHARPDDAFMEFLDESYTMVDYQRYRTAAVWLYEVKPREGMR